MFVSAIVVPSVRFSTMDYHGLPVIWRWYNAVTKNRVVTSSPTMQVPGLRFHAHSKRWRATFAGQTIYYSSDRDEAEIPYRKDLQRWLAAGGAHQDIVTIAALTSAVIDWAEDRYVKSSGGGGEAKMIKHALGMLDRTVTVRLPKRPIEEVYLPELPADEFTSVHMAAVQEQMIVERHTTGSRAGQLRFSRSYINAITRRVKTSFRQARRMGLVERETVIDLCESVAPVPAGHATVKETLPVEPVADHYVNAIKPHVKPMVWALVQVCRLTGMRIGEVLAMRVNMIDRSQDPWVYDLGINHKTAQRRYAKRVMLRTDVQPIIAPWLEKAMGAHEVNATLWPSVGKSGVYLRSSVRDAIVAACRKAQIPEWSTHQLRHARGTEVFEQALEAARRELQHKSAETTKGYIGSDAKARA